MLRYGQLPNQVYLLSSQFARDSRPVFELANVAWCKFSSPKMSCCLLRALQNKLPTRCRLKQFGIINQDSCVLCSSSSESVKHLFLTCPFSAYIWELCRLKLGLHQPILLLLDEAKLFLKIYSKRIRVSALGKVAISAAVWHIWFERNQRIFQAMEASKVQVFRRLYEDVNVLLKTCQWKVCNGTSDQQVLSN